MNVVCLNKQKGKQLPHIKTHLLHNNLADIAQKTNSFSKWLYKVTQILDSTLLNLHRKPQQSSEYRLIIKKTTQKRTSDCH